MRRWKIVSKLTLGHALAGVLTDVLSSTTNWLDVEQTLSRACVYAGRQARRQEVAAQ